MSNQIEIACDVDEEDFVFTTVDGIYAAMDEGNRCHMANKLAKHGYIPTKLKDLVRPPLPDGAKYTEEFYAMSSRESDRNIYAGVWYNGAVFAINVQTGRVWSGYSEFGARDFTHGLYKIDGYSGPVAPVLMSVWDEHVKPYGEEPVWLDEYYIRTCGLYEGKLYRGQRVGAKEFLVALENGSTWSSVSKFGCSEENFLQVNQGALSVEPPENKSAQHGRNKAAKGA